MMILALADLQDLPVVFESRADALVFGLKGFSARCNADLKTDELSEMACRVHESGRQFFVNMLAMIEQAGLQAAARALQAAVEAAADGIYVADEGYIQLAQDLEAKSGLRAVSRLIYQPETLICSGQDARFYHELGLQAQSLAHELSVEEMTDCARHSPDLEALVAGHTSWMESRRPLLENYLSHIGCSSSFEEGSLYSLRELQRTAQLPVWQDALGTHVLSDQPVQAGAKIVRLAQAGIRRFRVDGLIRSNLWAAEQCNLYAAALENGSLEALPVCTFLSRPLAIRKEKSA